MPLYSRRQYKPPQGVMIDPLHPLAQGLVGAWAFNESGPTVRNLAGPSNNGTFAAGAAAPTRTSSRNGPAISVVSTSSQYVDCGVFPALNGASKVTLFAIGTQVVSKSWSFGRADTANFRVMLTHFGNGTTYAVCENGVTSSGLGGVTSVEGYHSLSMVYDGTRTGTVDRLFLYVDGVNNPLTSGATPAIVPTTGADTVKIGNDVADTSLTYA